MDYQLKIAEGIPSPQHYKQIRVWSARSNRSPKIDTSLKKYTYLDLIETEQKNRKKPAPGDYKQYASDADIKDMQLKLDQRCKKRRVSQKRYFYEDG
jgi:cytochrome c553